MSQPHTLLLQHLVQLLAWHYCHHHFAVGQLTKGFFIHCLNPAIEARLHIEYGILLSQETLYNVARKGMCGTATKEKLAILYFAVTGKLSVELASELYLRLLKLKKITHTPYYDLFVKQYERQHKKAKAAALPKGFYKTLHNLSPKDYQKIKQLIEKEDEVRGKKLGIEEKCKLQ